LSLHKGRNTTDFSRTSTDSKTSEPILHSDQETTG
jgi:hypothetical protein